jgi:two-component system OmpR family response regulator
LTSTPHIMVVDDDREIRTLLCEFLDKNGFHSHPLNDGAALDRAMQKQKTDLIVLDLMLPGEDGFAICRRLRQRSSVPIIMLTARDEDVDQIVGFEVGADDYVRKPFNPRALLARIRAVLRRADQGAQPALSPRAQRYRFAGWQLNTIARSLQRDGEAMVDLNGAEYELLLLMLADPQRVWSRLELSQLIHGRDNDPFDRSIDVRISRLRQKLGDSARTPAIIKTVYGGGYFLGVTVEAE